MRQNMNLANNIVFCILIYLVQIVHFIFTLVNLFLFYFESMICTGIVIGHIFACFIQGGVF